MDPVFKDLVQNIPLPTKTDDALSYFRTWHEYAAPTGIYGVNIPSRYGGLGLSHEDRFSMISEMSAVSPSAGAILQSVTLGVGMFLSAPEAVKEYWLPKLATGEEITSICITEPFAGARVGSMETSIECSGPTEFLLEGKKQFIANSHIATVHGVIAKANTLPGHPFRHVAAVVPQSRKGVKAGLVDDLDGLHHFNVGQLGFDGVRVKPKELFLGEDGLTLGHRSITLFGKLNLAAVAFGAFKRSWSETLEFLDSDIGRSKDLIRIPAINQIQGKVQLALEESEALCLTAAKSIDNGCPNEARILAAKATTCDLALTGILDCISIMGARGGSVWAGHVQRLNDVIQTLAPAGTATVNLTQLGKISTGLYREVGMYDA